MQAELGLGGRVGGGQPNPLPLNARASGVDAASCPAPHPPQCSRSSDAMGTRYFLALFLILLVLGFGECDRQRRQVCEEGDDWQASSLAVPVRPCSRPLPSCPAHSPPAAGLSAVLTHSPPAEVQGAPLTQEDEASSTSLFSQMQESLYSYWDTAKTAAQDLYQKTYLTTVDESIRYHSTPTDTPGVQAPSPCSLRPSVLSPQGHIQQKHSGCEHLCRDFY